MTDTYSDVDASADVAAALDWQDRVDAWPQVRAYKEDTYRGTDGRRPVLDVGCGTGHDLIALGGAAVGVDHSTAMARRARERGCTVAIADAGRLPFADASFGSARSDRVFQHLPAPMEALDEMVRVTRPGGRIVVADPDQESLVIHVPGVRPELVARVKQLRRDVGYRNGHLVSSLPERFWAAGMLDVQVRAFPLLLTDPEDAFGLPTWVAYWRERGHGFDASDVREWDAGMARAREGGFLFALLYLVVTGTVP